MRKTIPLVIILLSLVLAACQPAPAPPPTIDQTQVADSVNATLAAQGPPPTQAPPAQTEPTSAPTEAPPPTSTPIPVEGDPILILGEPDGEDNFNSDSNWTLFDNQCFKTEIVDGQFVMESKGLEGVICWEVSWPHLENFYMETEMEMPEQCQPDDRFGMLFRAPDNFRGYQYGLTCDGRYYLSMWDGNQTTVLVEPATNPVIKSGPGEVNRLGVAAYAGEYLLYANGTYLGEGVNYTYTEPGQIGYFVRATTDQGFVTRYDNLKVWLLDDQFYHPTDPTPPITEVIPPPPAGVPTVTTETYVNVRSGPGLNYPIYFVVPPGTAFEAAGITSDVSWYAVKVPTTISGSGIAWVSADYVLPADTAGLPVLPIPPLPPGVVFPPPEANAPTVTNFEPLNVRSGPGNQYPSYGAAPIGSSAPVIGVSQDGIWYAVVVPTTVAPDGIGWVNANYVTLSNPAGVEIPVITNPEELPPVSHPPPAEGVPTLTSTDAINVRSGPSTACTSYGVSAIGASAEALGISSDGSWYVVVVPTDVSPDGMGWVNANYVIASNTENLPVMESQICP